MDNLRRFLFTLSAVVFLALCIGGYVTALKYDPKEIQREPGDPTPLPAVGNVYDPEKYQYEDLFDGNVLYVLTSSKKQDAVNFLISHYDPTTRALSYLLVPDTVKAVDHDAGNQVLSLGEYFGKYGGESTAKYLTSMLEIDIPCYTVLTYDTLSELIAQVNSVKCELPYPIQFLDTDTSDISYSTGINYPQGTSTISGSSAINMIRFIRDTGAHLSSDIVSYYNDADPQEIHSAMSDDFIYYLLKGFTDNSLISENQDKFKDWFQHFTDSYDTNLKGEHLDGMCHDLGKIDRNQVKYYLVTGKYQYNGDFYVAYNNTLRDLNTGSEIAANEVLDYQF